MRQAADGMKGVVLELGGKSPNVVLPGVGAAAVAEAVHLRYLRNAGQGCASPTRLLVPRAELDEFLAASREVFARVPVGDPWDPATITGPVITAAHRDRIQAYVDDAVAGGAEVLASGSLPDGPGWWSRPDAARRRRSRRPRGARGDLRTGRRGPALRRRGGRGADRQRHGVRPRRQRLRRARPGPRGRRADPGRAGRRSTAAARSARTRVFGGFGASGVGREHGEHGIREFLEPQHVQWAVPA